MHAQLEITPVKENSVFLEKLNHAILYSDTVNIIIGLDISDIITQVNNIETFKHILNEHVRDQPQFLDELNSVGKRLRNVQKLAQYLKQLTHSRIRRGLINIVGSLSKTLFGTLDNDDLTLVNQNIDKLFDNENRLKTIIANQTALIKKIINSDSLAKIESLNQDVSTLADTLQKDNIYIAMILEAEAALQDLHFQLDELLNVIILGKQGIISPQILDQQQFMKGYAEALGERIYNTAVSAKPEHFQFILDISELKVFTIGNRLFFEIIVPVLSNMEWDIYQVYPIPSKRNGIFMAPLVENQIYLTHGLSFINTDMEYLDKFCKQKVGITLCKQTQPIHDRNSRTDCQSEVINFSTQVRLCQLVVYKIQDISFIPLKTSNQYLAIPKEPIDINVICGSKHTTQRIEQPSLLKTNESCDLLYSDEHMRIGETQTNVTYIIQTKQIALRTNDTFISLLDTLEKAPKIINNVQGYRTTLDRIIDETNQMNIGSRIKTIQYWGLTTLQVLGYTALLGVTIYGMSKIGLFKCIRSCVPNKLCIQLFCCKTENHNAVAPQLAPSTPINLYSSLASAPLGDPPGYIEEEDEEPPEPSVLIKPRHVRFHKRLTKRT